VALKVLSGIVHYTADIAEASLPLGMVPAAPACAALLAGQYLFYYEGDALVGPHIVNDVLLRVVKAVAYLHALIASLVLARENYVSSEMYL